MVWNQSIFLEILLTMELLTLLSFQLLFLSAICVTHSAVLNGVLPAQSEILVHTPEHSTVEPTATETVEPTVPTGGDLPQDLESAGSYYPGWGGGWGGRWGGGWGGRFGGEWGWGRPYWGWGFRPWRPWGWW